MPQDQPPTEHDEIHNEDFQFVLKALLAAYQPVLEEDLKRAGAPESLKEEAESKPPSWRTFAASSSSAGWSVVVHAPSGPSSITSIAIGFACARPWARRCRIR
jgi:hypothetical protein